MSRVMLLGLMQLVFVLANCDHAANRVPLVTQNLKSRLNSHVDQLISTHWKQELVYLYYGTYFDRADVALPGFSKLFNFRSLGVGKQRANMTTMLQKRGGYVSYGTLDLNSMCDTMEQSIEDNGVKLDWDNKPYSCSAYIFRFLKKDDKINPYAVKNNVHNRKKNGKKRNRKGKGSRVWSFFSGKAKQECNVEDTDEADWRPALYALRDMIAMEKFIIQKVLSVTKLCADDQYDDAFMRHSLEEYLHEPTTVIKEATGLLYRLLSNGNNRDNYLLAEYVMDHELGENGGQI